MGSKMNAFGKQNTSPLNSCVSTHGGVSLLIDKPILDELSDSSLHTLIQRYAKTADFIREVLTDRVHRRHNSAHHDQQQKQVLHAAHLVAIQIETFGLSYDRALDQIAQQSGLDHACLAENFRRYMKTKNRLSRAARDAVVLRMAQSKTNGEISKLVGLSAGRVSQIIKEHFKKR